VTEDLDFLRIVLAARRYDCLDRLEDAVSELWTLHLVGLDEILAHVQGTIDRERFVPDRGRAPEVVDL
jgi:hypothetical protein